jgi:hypothetical protein
MQLLRRGDTGPAVAQLRAMLTSQGLLPAPSNTRFALSSSAAA